MAITEEHTSRDGLFRLLVCRDDQDVSIGFDGFSWHTHSDLLAAATGLPEERAVRQFVDDILADRAVIAVARLDGQVSNVWISDDPELDVIDKPENETIEYRYWSGAVFRARPIDPARR